MAFGLAEYRMKPHSADFPTTLVTIETENLDAAFSSRFDTILLDSVRDGPIILDLEKVRFADSVGVGILVSAVRRWPNSVRMKNVGPFLRRCLQRVPADLLPEEVIAPKPGKTVTNPQILVLPKASFQKQSKRKQAKTTSNAKLQEFGT